MEETLVALMLADAAVTVEVGQNITWNTRPQASGLPAIVLHRVGGRRDTTMGGASGLVESRVQADIYGATFLATKQAARAVVALLNGVRLDGAATPIVGVFLDAVRDSFEGEEPQPVHRTSLDFRVWHHEA